MRQFQAPGSQPTIPGAVFKRPVLVLVVALSGLLLGVIAGQFGDERYEATAKIVVQDPRTLSASPAAQSSPDRYVSEQLAIFELDTVMESAAQTLNSSLREAARSSSSATVAVGEDGAVVVGIDGSVRFPASQPAVELGADRSVRLATPGTPTVDSTGRLTDATGSPILDLAGIPLAIQSNDSAVIRADGTIVIIRPGTGITIVEPPGRVVSVPQPVDEAPATEPTALRSNSDGTLIIPFGQGRAVAVGAALRPVALGGDGAPFALPGRTTLISVDQNLLLLGLDGTLVGQSATETVVLDAAGEAVVLDPDGSTLALSDAAVVSGSEAASLAAGTTEFDSRAVVGSSSVSAKPDSNLIEVRFNAATPEEARLGANAIVGAYEQLQVSDTARSNAAALARADDSIAQLTSDLLVVERELAAARLGNPSRSELAAQYDRLLAAVAVAGQELLGGTAAQSTAAAQRVRDLLTQLDAIEQVEQAEQAQPELSEIVSRRDQIRDRLAQVQTQRDALRIDAERGADNIVLASPATDARPAAGLGPTKLGFVGILLGAMAAALVAYLLELRKPSVESVEEVSEMLSAPLLAEIPDFRHERLRSQLPVLDEPGSYAAEAVRMAAAVLTMSFPEHAGIAVGVVSASTGDGKTTLAVNLAAALAKTDRRVLALDADLEGQIMTLLLTRHGQIDLRASGLADVIQHGLALEEAVQPVPLADDGELDLLAAGLDTAQLRTLLDTDQTRELLMVARESYEVIVVDVPPVLNVAYAAPLLRQLDGAIVVVPDGSPMRDLVELRARLDLIGVPTFGFVYNRAPLRPERTTSLAAIHYDLGGRPTNRAKWAKRRAKLRRRAAAERPPSRSESHV